MKLAGNFAFHNTIWINNVNSTTKLGKVLIKYTESEEKVILNDCTCIYSYAFVNNENIKKMGEKSKGFFNEFKIYDHRKKTNIYNQICDYLSTTKVSTEIFSHEKTITEKYLFLRILAGLFLYYYWMIFLINWIVSELRELYN